MDPALHLQPPTDRSSRISAHELAISQSSPPSELSLTHSAHSSSVTQTNPSPASEIPGQLNRTLPLCNRSDNSDANKESPWSRKIILALDGGGVRGYSSLLILKRLFFLISQIETGRRKGYITNGETIFGVEPSLTRYEACQTSEEYPWFVDTSTGDERMHVMSPPPIPMEDENEDQDEDEGEDDSKISTSVDETFATGAIVSQFKPHHYFDYIAGTSTGGLSAIMLARMELDIDSALKQYDVIGNEVFAKPRLLHASIKGVNAIRPKYPSRNLERAMQSVIKESLKQELHLDRTSEKEVAFAHSSARCRAILVAHGPADDRNLVKHEYLFRTYDHPPPSPFSKWITNDRHCNPGPASREPIWKVARATSAAPMYFSTMSIGERKYRDGGLVANNPALLAFEEVDQMHEQDPRLVISVGTGEPENGDNESTPQRYFSYIKDGFDTIKAMRSLVTQTQRTHLDVSSRLDKEKVDYHRFNVGNGMKDIPLDQWNVKNGVNNTKKHLQDLTITYLKLSETHKTLLQCARTLVAARRRRATTERWENFATCYVYYCPEKNCTSMFKTREGLRNHAYDAHSFVWETTVLNDPSVKWACFWDQCLHHSVYIFRDKDAYIDHLKRKHGVEHGPRFANRHELEHWLDQGRKKPGQAIEDKEAYANKQKTMTVPAPREKSPKKPQDGSVSDAASKT